MDMNYDAITDKIEKFSEERHKGQTRRDGVTPYFTHIKRVANRAVLMGDSDYQKRKLRQIALLHDLIEDHRATRHEILNLHPLEEVMEALDLLTKDKYDDYLDYIREIKHDYLARKVKIADILDNLSDNPTEKQVIKYSQALLILLGKME